MDEFEDKIDEIDQLLKSNRDKWRLDSITWIDYDDISQLIRLHIYNQWSKWDQSRPFGPWCNTVISNQITNKIRDNYRRFAKPCLGCPHYVSETGCALTVSKVQDSSCPDYAKWEKKKKPMHDIKMPLPLEPSFIDVSTDIFDEFDFFKSSDNLHEEILQRLKNDKHQRIYQLLFVEGSSEAEVAKEMGFKREAGNRKAPRYKQLDNIKSKFVEIAKKVLQENEIIESREK